MAKVLVVTSGKGGVGKTTSTAALGAALAQIGKNVVVVDFDVGLRNLDLVMGAERRVVYDLINVVQGDAKLTQALIRDKRLETLYLLPASQTRDKDALTEEGVERVIGELREQLRLGDLRQPGRHRARRDAGHAPCRCRRRRHQSGSLLGARFRPHHRPARFQDRARPRSGERMEKHLLLTRYDPARAERGEMLKIDDVLEILSIPLLGIIPESEEVLQRLQYRLAGHASPIRSARRRAPISTPRGGCRAKRVDADHPERQEGLVRQVVRTEGRMNLFSFFSRRGTAPVARDRLQILLAHERTHRRRVRSRRDAARGDPRGHRQARARSTPTRSGQDGARRVGLDAGGRHRDPDADQGDPAAARAGRRDGDRRRFSGKPRASEAPDGGEPGSRRHVRGEGFLEIGMPARKGGAVLDDVAGRPGDALLVDRRG